MRVLISFLLFMQLSFLSPLLADEVLPLYQNKQQSIQYIEKDDLYRYSDGDQDFSFSRLESERFKETIRPHIEQKDWPKLAQRIDDHVQWQKALSPAEEEILEEGLAAKSLAFDILEHSQAPPCQGSPQIQKQLQGPIRYRLELTEQASGDGAQEFDQALKESFVNHRSFVNLGELTAMDIEFESGNDNPLLGALSAAGITEDGEGIEGDDRGKTMSQNFSMAFLFSDGHVKLSAVSTGYGRKAPKTIPLKGLGFGEKKEYRDEEGRIYLEYLGVDGLELEVRKDLENDYYAKITGKREVFDDEGLAQKIQENWHDAMSSVSERVAVYDYQDHMDQDVRYSAGLEVGRELVLKRTDSYIIDSQVAATTQYSNRDSGKELGLKGEIRISSSDGEGKENRFPTWQARLYVDGRIDGNEEETLHSGVELSRRFRFDEDKFVTFSGSVNYEDDPLSRAYGAEELEDNNGKLDLYHRVSIKFEKKF